MNTKPSDSKIKLLFLCTGNSCRSQMAEGWTRHLLNNTIEAFSAGTEKHGVNPLAVRVMHEAGVDISGQSSKTTAELKDIEFDYVITLCDNAAGVCPWYPAKQAVIHHPFDNPALAVRSAWPEEYVLGVFRRVRDEIKAFVKTLPFIL